jgi:hypothetical protein
LETGATDKAFFMGVYKLHRAGYIAGQAPEVVAALTLDALLEYEKDPSAALRHLMFFENHFRREPPVRQATDISDRRL